MTLIGASEVGSFEGFQSIPHFSVAQQLKGHAKDENIYLVDNYGLYSERCASLLEKELGFTNVNVISGIFSRKKK